MILTLLVVALAMFIKDGLGTLLVVAESRGRHWLAGALDAAGDVAQIVTYAIGAGEIVLHGWTGKSFAILAVMMVTSFFGTALWTWLGRRIKAEDACIPDSHLHKDRNKHL